MKQNGFSLVELVIVIAIIGILSTIAITSYQNYTTRSRLAEVFTVSSGLKSTIAEAYTFSKACPDNSSGTTGGVLEPMAYATNVIDNITISNASTGCNINVMIKNDAPVAYGARGKVITLTLMQTSGAFYWDCSSNLSVFDSGKYLPAICN